MQEQYFDRLRKDTFKVPENYFEGLEESVFDRMKQEGPSEGKLIPITKESGSPGSSSRIWWISGAVAAFLAALIYFNIPSNQSPAYDLSGIENEDIIQYLNENADDVELDLLVNNETISGNAFDLLKNEQLNTDGEELLDDVSIEDLY